MPITKQIHGHEILHLLHAAKTPMTRAQLTQEAQRRFGAGARYCTCAAEGMTLDELLTFLAARRKVVEKSGRLVADISQMCSDDEQETHQ